MSDLVAELEKVKKDIRSLLISAPNGLTPKMLEKDYAAVIGQQLPFQKFGFCNSFDFLRSLTDILHVVAKYNQVLLFGIADESTAHILKLVQRQKKTKFYTSVSSATTQPCRNKQRGFNTSLKYPTALTRAGMHKVLQKYPEGFSITKLHAYYSEVNGTKLDVDSVNGIPPFVMQMPDIAKLDFGKKEKCGNNLYVFPSNPTAISQNQRNSSQMNTLSSTNKASTTRATTPSTVTNTFSNYRKVAPMKKVSINSSVSQHAEDTSNKVLNGKFNSISRFHKGSSSSAGILSENLSSETKSTLNSSGDTDALSLEKSLQASKSSNNDSDFSSFEDVTPPASALLKQEILGLLKDCKTEIRSIKVASLYKKKYAKELNLHKHGYYSIIELIATMTDRISMCRINRTGDWLLKLRSVKPEKSNDSTSQHVDKAAQLTTLEKEFKELLTRYKGGIAVESLEDLYEMHFERTLPMKELNVNSAPELICKITDTLDLCNNQLCLLPSSACTSLKSTEPTAYSAPLDAVGFGVRYNPPLLPLQEWGFFNCYVTYVNTPGDFRIQIIGEETTEAFNTIMDDIERTYCNHTAKAYRIPPHMIVPGQICVALYHGDNNWNRAVIEDHPVGGFVTVRYVDYGDIAAVATGNVYFLKKKHHELPILEVHARLSNIQPANSNKWDLSARKLLLDFSKNKQLVAKVTDEHEHSGHKVFSLELCDVSSFDDVYINDLLLEKRLATLVNDNELSPIEVEQLFERSEKRDIPSESPPPYQATEDSIPPPLVDGKSLNKCPKDDALLARLPPLSTVQPPPGFGNVAPRQDKTADEITMLLAKLKEQHNALNFAKKEQNKPVDPDCKLAPQRCQKKFLKPFRLTDELKIHVINFKGTALLLSGEISRVFRPQCDDMLAPLLMMKEVHENFPELVLPNSDENDALFREFRKLSVKDAFKSDGKLRSVVTLYRLTDVPEILTELEHPDCEALHCRLAEIISIFDPDSAYWYRDDTASLGGKALEEAQIFPDSSSATLSNAPLDRNLACCSSSTCNTGAEKSSSGCSRAGKNQVGSQEVLTKKRDSLLQLLSNNSPSLHLFNELKDVMKGIDVEQRGAGDSPEVPVSSEMCAIPSEAGTSSLKNVFSEIRQGCGDSLHLRQVPLRNTFT